MTRKLLFLCVFGVVYTVGAMILILTTMGAAMSGFEPGSRPVGPLVWRILSTLTEVVMLPFGPLLLPRGARGLWGYALIYANGVAWGMILLAGWHFLERSRRNHPKAA
jgi:hypothetical protein